MKKELVLIILTFFSWATVFGEGQVTLKAQVDKALVPSTETLTYTVTLIYPKAQKVEFPQVGGQIEGFRVVDFGQKGPWEDPLDNSRMVAEKWFKLQGDISGTYMLPAVEVGYADSTGQQKKARAGEIFVEVTGPDPAGKDKATEKKEIRGLKDIYRTPFPWAKTTVLILLLALAGGLLYWLIKKPKKEKSLPPLLPHQRALAALAELAKANWENAHVDFKKSKIFSFRLSEIMRLYIEERFSFAATDRTLEEIRRDIEEIILIQDPQKKEFLNISEQLELVKFADKLLSVLEITTLIEAAHNFINKTKPLEVTAPTPNKRQEDFL